MKILFYNGNIYIYISDNTFAYAFVIEDNIITKIFKTKDSLKDKFDVSINLNKNTVIPSLIDGHNHFLMASNNIENINISKIRTESELLKTLKQHYLKNKNQKYLYFEGLVVNNFNLIIDKTLLDKISKDIPIIIYSSDRHTAFLNSASLDLFKITKYNYKSIYGGIIELDEDLVPNGVLKENACNYVNVFLKENQTKPKTLKLMKKLEEKLIHYGIGCVGTCDISETNIDKTISLYNKFNENKIINIVHQCPLFNLDNVNNFINVLSKENLLKDNFQIKLFIDGSLSSLTAALSTNYLNKKTKGHINYEKSDLKKIIKDINSKNISVVTHCIGDKAIEQAIDIFSSKDGVNKHNNGIIHYQINNRNLDNKIANYNINVCIQPCFIEDDLNIINKYLHRRIINEAYKYHYLYLKNNDVISFGTDAPICDYNPWKNIYYAITNQQTNGNKKIQEESNFSIYDAIKCYTINAAKFLGIQKTGLIKENYYANFIVLDQNIFKIESKKKKKIIETKVLSHYINGKKVF